MKALFLISVLILTGCSSVQKKLEKHKLIADSSVVRVFSADSSGGTGFYLNTPKGQVIITNAHVCGLDPEMYIIHKGTVKALSVLKLSIDDDLCALSIPSRNKLAFNLGPNTAYNMLPVHTFGFPRLDEMNYSSGYAIGLSTIDSICGKPGERFLINFFIFPGQSGSPVFNEAGQVVGVIQCSKPFTMGVAIPGSILRTFIKDL